MKKIPSVIQLPGGVQLQGLVFRVVEYNDDGSPHTRVCVKHGLIGKAADALTEKYDTLGAVMPGLARSGDEGSG